jgi:hypothetical protein
MTKSAQSFHFSDALTAVVSSQAVALPTQTVSPPTSPKTKPPPAKPLPAPPQEDDVEVNESNLLY